MPRSPQDRTGPPAAPDGGLSDEQVARWADLAAEGRGGAPDGLPPRDRQRLLAAARRRLRDRLVRLIARAVAWRLRRQGGPGTEDPNDARTQV